jgi:N-glycosidase YbiA
MNRILFYGTKDPYGEFSNFAPFPIRLKNRSWPTSEHYFQAQKFPGTSHEEEIRRAKFSQHPQLQELLLGTGEAGLVEHTANDDYWADGGDGTGRNRLGVLLMQVRSELRAAR